jgi:hypothetical protein
MSRVKRVLVSNVRMPRSHRTTFGLPCDSTYSAACRNSADRGRQAALEEHRLAALAGLGEQREVLAVAGADLQHVGRRGDVSTSSGAVTSVTIGMPVAARASASRASPSSPSPWNE